MKWLLLVAGLLAGYFTGAAVGASHTRAVVDWEWARMLENDMVGPGSTTRPGTGSALSSVRISGGV